MSRFNIFKFHEQLKRSYGTFDSSSLWIRFPSDNNFKFKKEILQLLEENIQNKDKMGLWATIVIISVDGADKGYTLTLLDLLDANWHISEEDIVTLLESIKDPTSVDKLYEVALNVPDYDDMRALAKKCMWALSAINTPEAVEKLRLLQQMDDVVIKENATFQLEEVLKLK